MFFEKNLPAWFCRLRTGIAALIGLAAISVAGATVAAQPAVTVNKHPPTVSYRVFDPARPPVEIQRSYRADEAGLCQYEFSGKVRTGIEFPRTAARESFATIASVSLDLQLKITVWTIIAATPKVHRHEETHRQIAEVYYANAERVATRLAREASSQKLRIPAQNRDAATTRLLDEFQSALLARYLAETATRCGVAQRAFDQLTDHGRNAVPENEAMAAAIRQEHATRVPLPSP